MVESLAAGLIAASFSVWYKNHVRTSLEARYISEGSTAPVNLEKPLYNPFLLFLQDDLYYALWNRWFICAEPVYNFDFFLGDYQFNNFKRLRLHSLHEGADSLPGKAYGLAAPEISVQEFSGFLRNDEFFGQNLTTFRRLANVFDVLF